MACVHPAEGSIMNTEVTAALSTSLLRTYRNLRLGIAGTVILIGVAVGVVTAAEGVLPSISAYFYTSARSIFVGALIAAAVAILALSGRGIERVLLDAAGIIAPVIALVPTPIRAGSVPGFEGACPPGTSCTPASVLPDVSTGVITYLIVGVIVVAVTLAVTLARRRAEGIRLSTVLPSLAVAVLVFAVVAVGWWAARDLFLALAHLLAAIAFFGLMAVIAVVKVFEHPDAPAREPRRWQKVAYCFIAIVMCLNLVVMVIVVRTGVGLGATPPPVFIGECMALALFLAFWVLQTIQKWNETDPSFAPAVPR
jgi:hypothetical protein